MNQEDLEFLLQRNDPFLVWFSAVWCLPCKKMDKVAIEQAAKDAGIPYYFCDNDYTPGYCNVRRFPTFMYFEKKKIKATIVNSDTQTVCTWIRSLNDSNQ